MKFTVEENETLNGIAYLVKVVGSNGYLSTNSPGGGALHFRDKLEATTVCNMLNYATMR